MTPREINEAVAGKLGWVKTDLTSAGMWNHPSNPSLFIRDLPDYCHSIAAAWEIVERCKKDGIKIEFESYPHYEERKWWVAIKTEVHEGAMSTYDTFEAAADSAPMAICLAFLKVPDGV